MKMTNEKVHAVTDEIKREKSKMQNVTAGAATAMQTAYFVNLFGKTDITTFKKFLSGYRKQGGFEHPKSFLFI